MRGKRLQIGLALLVTALLLLVRPLSEAMSPRPPGVRVVIWHSQRGAEKDTLEGLLRTFNEAHAGAIVVEPLAVPDASFKDKLLRTVPRGAGPDVFLRPHNELGELTQDRTTRPIPQASLPFEGAYLPGLLEGVEKGGEVHGLPLTYKALFLFYNQELLPAGPPAAFEDLDELQRRLPEGTFPLAYDATSYFFHAPFFLAAGGAVFEPSGGAAEPAFAVFSGEGPGALALPGTFRQDKLIPPDPSYNEAIRLFEAGQAATLICGPWYRPTGPLADRGGWGIAPLFTWKGRPMGSFVTIEAAYVSASTGHPAEALEVASFLAGPEGQARRFAELGLPPVSLAAYDDPSTLPVARDPVAAQLARVQRASLEAGVVTPSSVRMAAVWRPADDVVKASAAGRDVDAALDAARYTLSRIEAERPPTANAAPYGIFLVGLLGLGTMMIARRVRMDSTAPDVARARLGGFWGRAALPYLLPGVSAALVLVLAPVIAAAAMSLFDYREGRFEFVGLANFGEVLFPPLERALSARSFWFSLGVTVLWTILNVTLHVAIGVAVAMLLRPAYVRFRTAFRLLLILPWAIPNYITALMWKGMFHAQVGAINAILEPFGFTGFNWFDRFGTAFFANLVTNTWLGFPFMMVVTLGALSSIPKELEEAAILDGASRWQRFVRVILPQIRPALLPSVILGSVWTFNMFNVVYLVSGGEPGSQTDILVSEAYRWAFERGQRYGFAAAYSVLIFGVLLAYAAVTGRASKAEPA